MEQSSLHLAVIMDGNGRWADRRGLPRFAGHRAGADALRSIVEAAPSCGVEMLTVYAFSADNWKRPSQEVEGLMMLMASYLEDEVARLAAEGIRVSIIGRRDRLPARLLKAIHAAEVATDGNRRLHLRIAIDYSARESILLATERAAGRHLTFGGFEELLGETRPVDLLIRTGGEQRLSDFLLWECAYAELVFTHCMWPDFNEVQLRHSIAQFHRRDRRFGDVRACDSPIVQTAAADSDVRWLH